MVKLARNALAELLIKWEYRKMLNEIRLGNKLSNQHVRWTKAKMKVKLAAQTFSSSVADTLELLTGVDGKFKDVGATITIEL